MRVVLRSMAGLRGSWSYGSIVWRPDVLDGERVLARRAAALLDTVAERLRPRRHDTRERRTAEVRGRAVVEREHRAEPAVGDDALHRGPPLLLAVVVRAAGAGQEAEARHGMQRVGPGVRDSGL